MPPYSDNLYSADDSDDESFSAELSPTNGYFNQRDQSQNALVTDPSIGSSTAESKAREAREEAEGLANSTSDHRESSTIQSQSSPLPSSEPSHRFAPASSIPTLYTQFPPNSTINIPVSPTSPRRSAPTAPQRVQRTLYSEVTPLLYPTAPPAYSPSSSSSQDHRRNYNTISNTTSPDHLEEGRIFLSREPESMGEPSDGNFDRTPLIRKPVISTTRRFIQKAILFIAAIALAASFITATIEAAIKPDKNLDSTPRPPMDDTDPVNSGGSYCPLATTVLCDTQLSYDFTAGKSISIIQRAYDNDDYKDKVHSNTEGEIRIRRLPEDSPFKDGLVTAKIRISDPSMRVEVQTEHDASLIITSPQFGPRPTSNVGERPCVSIEVTLWLPDNAKMTTLELQALTLNVKVDADVTAHIIESTDIKTLSGSVIFPSPESESKSLYIGLPKMPKKSWWLPNIPYFRPKFPFLDDDVEKPEDNKRAHVPLPEPESPELSLEGPVGLFISRKQYIETGSGSIQGIFTLYDYLHIISHSGSIQVDILPQEEDPDAPAPAELFLHTISGSIQGYFPFNGASAADSRDPRHTIPEREYRTHVDSNSGRIKGNFVLGVDSYFKSLSGSIQLEMLTGHTKYISNPKSLTSFSTETYSGSTKVEIVTPAFRNRKSDENETGEPMRNLSSNHQGKSGSMKLFYPSAWEGLIFAKALSGSIRLQGEGVVIDWSKNWANKEIRAHKGDIADVKSGSQMSVNELSGSVDVLFGRSW